MNTMQNFSRTDLVTACYYICCFFWVLRLKFQVGVITRMDAMQSFLELIWLLHVIAYVVFFFFFFWGGGGGGGGGV